MADGQFDFHHYRVLTDDDGHPAELGRGAMGITYRAVDTNLDVEVALKVINPRLLGDENTTQRFLREARAAASLRHPNVASVFHLGEAEDTVFYAMEFVAGETLTERVNRTGLLGTAEALTIAGQVAYALTAAEKKSIVHRDIKPDNVMIERSDDGDLHVKLIDFGLAKNLQPDPDKSAWMSMDGFVGTPIFSSPEQLEEQPLDVRSDIYSLGITLWYALSGQPPFTGTVATLMRSHLSTPPPLEQLANQPEPVRALLGKMLEKDPADRHPSATILRREVRACLETIAGTVSGPSQRGEGVGKLAGRYELLDQGYESSWGSRFRSWDGFENREVSLDVLKPEVAGDPDQLAQLEKVVGEARRLVHPNVIRCFGFERCKSDQGESQVLLIREHFSSVFLFDTIRARESLHFEEAIAVFEGVVSATDTLVGAGFREISLDSRSIHLLLPDGWEELSRQEVLRKPLTEWPVLTSKVAPFSVEEILQPAHDPGATVVGTAFRGGVSDDHVWWLGRLFYGMIGGKSPSGRQRNYFPLPALSEYGNQVMRDCMVGDAYASGADLFEALTGERPATGAVEEVIDFDAETKDMPTTESRGRGGTGKTSSAAAAVPSNRGGESRRRREEATRLEEERAEQERIERERAEKERKEAEEKARLEQERVERERAEKEQKEAEEKARLEQERIERERVEEARLENEQAERERKDKEKQEREEKERLKQEAADKKRREKESAEAERRRKREEKAAAKERQEKDRLAAEAKANAEAKREADAKRANKEESPSRMPSPVQANRASGAEVITPVAAPVERKTRRPLAIAAGIAIIATVFGTIVFWLLKPPDQGENSDGSGSQGEQFAHTLPPSQPPPPPPPPPPDLFAENLAAATTAWNAGDREEAAERVAEAAKHEFSGAIPPESVTFLRESIDALATGEIEADEADRSRWQPVLEFARKFEVEGTKESIAAVEGQWNALEAWKNEDRPAAASALAAFAKSHPDGAPLPPAIAALLWDVVKAYSSNPDEPIGAEWEPALALFAANEGKDDPATLLLLADSTFARDPAAAAQWYWKLLEGPPEGKPANIIEYCVDLVDRYPEGPERDSFRKRVEEEIEKLSEIRGNPISSRELTKEIEPSLLLRAAESQILSAMYFVGNQWASGFPPAGTLEAKYTDEEMDQNAFEWFSKAAEEGYPQAEYAVAECYLLGRGVRENKEEGRRRLREIDESEWERIPGIVYHLALAEEEAQGKLEEEKRDLTKQRDLYKKTIELYEKKVELGEFPYYGELGRMLIEGKSGDREIKKGYEYLEEGADKDDKNSLWLLGLFLLEENPVQKELEIKPDPERGKEYIRKAAKLRHSGAIDWCKANNVSLD